MNILKHGNTYGIRECPNCSCSFDYCGENIKKETVTTGNTLQNMDFIVIGHYIECPECRHNIPVLKQDLKKGKCV